VLSVVRVVSLCCKYRVCLVGWGYFLLLPARDALSTSAP